MMKKSSRKILCSMIMAVLFSGGMGSSVYAVDIDGNNNNGSVTIGDINGNITKVDYEYVYGYIDYDGNDSVSAKEANGGNVQIYNAAADNSICIYGGLAMNNNSNASKLGDAEANGNTMHLENLTFEGSGNGEIIGGVAVSRPNNNTGQVHANGNQVALVDSKGITGIIIGGYANRTGASSKDATTNDNSVWLSGSEVAANIYGGNIQSYSAGNGNAGYGDDNNKNAVAEANNNQIVIENGSVIGRKNAPNTIYGSYIYYFLSSNTANAISNTVRLTDSTVYGDVLGTYVRSFQCSTGNADPNIKTVLYAEDNHVYIQDNQVLGTVKGAYAYDDSNFLNSACRTINNSVEISGISSVTGSIYGADNYSRNSGGKAVDGEVRNNYVNIDGDISVKDGAIYGGSGYSYAYRWSGDAQAGDVGVGNNAVSINGDVTIEADIYGGYAKSQGGGDNDRKPTSSSNHPYGNAGDAIAEENQIAISGGSVTGTIYGGYAESTAYREGQENYEKIGKVEANGNRIIISGGSATGTIYGGYAESTAYRQGQEDHEKIGPVEANGNVITLQNTANLSGADLYGSNLENTDTEGNNLVIDGWIGKVNSLNNFDSIDFKNLTWKNQGTVLEIGDEDGSSLAGTNIHLFSMAGGQDIHAGESMYIIRSSGTLDTEQDKINVEQSFTAGVAIDGTGEVSRDNNGNIRFEVIGTSVNDQINLIAENRAVAAAFVNQGTDLISDGMDALNRDSTYGLRTFAAVHGNRSQYDVNSELKINGWSTIVGVGSERKLGSGDFLWGIFYENGSGNYRTYNTFNNEFFRGDGSLLYNGGGIAARFEKDNGIYAEGSLRAGTLKSEMTNALRDGAGNSYGYESESTYYGAHIGAGKIFSVNETTDLDVYGKFFHTYTEGDRFAVAGDVFEFDGVTSNRLRIGSRVTTNKEDRMNLYYGLAYEYEFSGDAHMRAQGMSVPEQSLKGSSYMAEVGMNYKPGKTSPWGFDLNIRGYAGQREGISCSVLTSYTF